ncbi:MAG: hypothetical protein AVDCRST_MAG48-348, partial [uncultured Friedmanniella sp.]
GQHDRDGDGGEAADAGNSHGFLLVVGFDLGRRRGAEEGPRPFSPTVL